MADKKYNVVLSATDETRAAFDSMRKNIEDAQAPLLSFQNLAGAIGAGALIAMEKSAIDAGDEMFTLSQKTGIAVQDLAGLELAAKMNGASLDSVANGVKHLSTYMFDAASGTQANADVLRVLGITAKEPLSAMEQLADKFTTMQDGAEKSALAVKLFGKSGTDMIPLLDGGSAALRDMINEGQRLNPVTQQFAANANTFNDNLDRIQTAAKGNATIMANEFLPALNNTAEAILKASDNAGIFKAAGQALSATLIFLVESGANTIFFFKDLGNTIGGVSAQIVAALHGNFDEVRNIQKSMEDEHKTSLENLKAFKAEIENVNKATTQEQAKPAASNAIANALKEVEARRAAQAELRKMNEADDKYEIEHAKQAYDRHVKEMDALAKKDSEYFQSLRNKVQDMDKSDIQRDQLAAQRELQALALQREIMATDHNLSLGEQQQFEEARLNIIALHKKQEFEIGKAAAMQNLATAGTQFRALFELQKVARIADAIVSAKAAVVDAYKFGSSWGGPPGGAAMAAIAIAATAAQIAAIQSASFGGGTGAAGAGGGGGGAPLTTPSPLAPQAVPQQSLAVQAPQQVNMTIVGSDKSTFSYDQILSIISGLNQAADNGHIVKVNLVPA